MKSLLSKRQESIFSNLQQAQIRSVEMEQNLLEAQTKFENASKEVLEIGNKHKEVLNNKKANLKIKFRHFLEV